jgi:hypothetical protein
VQAIVPPMIAPRCGRMQHRGARSTKGHQAGRGVEGADVQLQRSRVTAALQRADLSELFTHWAFEPYQALEIVIAVVLIVIGARGAAQTRAQAPHDTGAPEVPPRPTHRGGAGQPQP